MNTTEGEKARETSVQNRVFGSLRDHTDGNSSGYTLDGMSNFNMYHAFNLQADGNNYDQSTDKMPSQVTISLIVIILPFRRLIYILTVNFTN